MSTEIRTFFRSQKSLIEQELAVHESIKKIIAEEQSALTRFSESKILEIAAQKEALLEKANEFSELRREALRSFGWMESLSLFLSAKGTMMEKKDLTPLIQKLRASVGDNITQAKEVSLLGSFAHQIAGSLLGIIHSAKHGISRRYNGTGAIQESFHPAGSRSGSVLKKV